MARGKGWRGLGGDGQSGEVEMGTSVMGTTIKIEFKKVFRYLNNNKNPGIYKRGKSVEFIPG